MNKIYRLKFSKEKKQLVVVSEITKGNDRKSTGNSLLTASSLLISLLSCWVTNAHAAPSGYDIVNGNVNIQQQGNITTITTSDKAIINWNDFSIQTHEIVNFIQDHANSSVLNRVTGGSLSEINGIINSNGNVFVINQNGIIFGKDSRVNANSFLASTLAITNENFKDGNDIFNAKDNAIANIINNGAITVNQQGKVALIGGGVENAGVITAPNGEVLLLAGNSITVFDLINPTVSYIISADSKAVNIGKIFAKGGKVNLSGFNVDNSGLIEAQGGNVNLTSAELTQLSGTIDVSNSTGKAGAITALSNKELFITSTAVLNASGREGGEIYLGGDAQGKETLILAERTTLEKAATLNISAFKDAGKAIIWGNQAVVSGDFIATSETAHGGFVETSGKKIQIAESIKMNTKSAAGKNGTWLIDPYNIRILASDSDMGELLVAPFSALEANSYILNKTIEQALQSGDVVIDTGTCTSSQHGDITVLANITHTGANLQNLTFNLKGNFEQNNSSIFGGNSGLNVIINTALNKSISFINNSTVNLGLGRLETNNASITVNNSSINSEFHFKLITTDSSRNKFHNASLGVIGRDSLFDQIRMYSDYSYYDIPRSPTYNFTGTLNTSGNITFLFDNAFEDSGYHKRSRLEWRVSNHIHQGGIFNYTGWFGKVYPSEFYIVGSLIDFYSANFTVVGEHDAIILHQSPYSNTNASGIAELVTPIWATNTLDVYGAGQVSISSEHPKLDPQLARTFSYKIQNFTMTTHNHANLTFFAALDHNIGDFALENLDFLHLNTHSLQNNMNVSLNRQSSKHLNITQGFNVSGPGNVSFAFSNYRNSIINAHSVNVQGGGHLTLQEHINTSTLCISGQSKLISTGLILANNLNIVDGSKAVFSNEVNVSTINLAQNSQFQMTSGILKVRDKIAILGNSSLNIAEQTALELGNNLNISTDPAVNISSSILANNATLNAILAFITVDNIVDSNVIMNTYISAGEDINLPDKNLTNITLHTPIQAGNFADIGTLTNTTPVNENITANTGVALHGINIPSQVDDTLLANVSMNIEDLNIPVDLSINSNVSVNDNIVLLDNNISINSMVNSTVNDNINIILDNKQQLDLHSSNISTITSYVSVPEPDPTLLTNITPVNENITANTGVALHGINTPNKVDDTLLANISMNIEDLNIPVDLSINSTVSVSDNIVFLYNNISIHSMINSTVNDNINIILDNKLELDLHSSNTSTITSYASVQYPEPTSEFNLSNSTLLSPPLSPPQNYSNHLLGMLVYESSLLDDIVKEVSRPALTSIDLKFADDFVEQYYNNPEICFAELTLTARLSQICIKFNSSAFPLQKFSNWKSKNLD